jgi:hypothetical protein
MLLPARQTPATVAGTDAAAAARRHGVSAARLRGRRPHKE